FYRLTQLPQHFTHQPKTDDIANYFYEAALQGYQEDN
ncbi:unnamed protein product, partial [Rotaria sp. Silwood1]